MGSFSLSGGVEVFGFISPSDTTDQYPVIDPLYGIDGLRNVDTLSDLDLIPTLRRRAGMVVGVSGGTIYYKLNSPPWNFNISDWSIFSSGGGVSGDYLPLSGGTVTGATTFNSGLTTNTISATTYQNLPIDVFVTGGTFSSGDIIFTNNTGGTFNVTGISSFDTFVTGFTYNDNTLTILQNSGSSLSVNINTMTGLTINGDFNVTGTTSSNIISATTYQNLPTDIRVTGGTLNKNTDTITFTNNTGGTFNVTGVTDTFVTGATFSGTSLIISQNENQPDVTANISTVSLSGALSSVTFNIVTTGGISASTISATTYQNLPTDIFVTGGTYSNGTTIFTNNTGGTFNVSGYFTGYTNVVNSLTTGVGLSGDVTTGDVTIINTAPDQVVTLSGGTNISVTGTYPNFNISFTGSTTSTFDYGKSYVIGNNNQWF